MRGKQLQNPMRVVESLLNLRDELYERKIQNTLSYSSRLIPVSIPSTKAKQGRQMKTALNGLIFEVIAPFGFHTSESSSPNELYRDWLEENCGDQNAYWDWELTDIGRNELTVRFKHSEHAVMFALTYGPSYTYEQFMRSKNGDTA